MKSALREEDVRGWHRYIERIPSPALLASAETGEVLLANEEARAVYGLTPHDVGRTTIQRLGFIDGASEDQFGDPLLSLSPGESAHFTYPASNSSSPARVAAVGIAGEGGAALVLMMVANVPDERGTDQRAEAREGTLRALIHANFAVCYDWDLASGSCVFWGRFDELLGLEASEHPTSIDSWLRLVHPDDVDRVMRKNQESIDSMQPYLDEYRMVHKDGRTVTVSDSGQLISDKRGTAARMVGGIRDITNEREMQLALEESNVALRVILNQRRQDTLELEHTIHENVSRLVIPTLDRIRHSLGNHPQVAQIDTLRQTLEEIVRPFSRRLTVAGKVEQPLTVRELEILDLVRRGKSTHEIADMLFLSRATVSFHRTNIRRKLGIPKRGRRLATHLASLEQAGSDSEAEADSDSSVAGPVGGLALERK